MALPVFTIARVGFTLYSTAEATGVLGWSDVASALARIIPKMVIQAKKRDSGALAEMVELARSRAPVDSGLLLNGITGEATENYHEFRASAVRVSSSSKEQEDYAHFVEFGTQAGVRTRRVEYAARDGLFSLDPSATSAFPSGASRTRARRQYRGHPGTPAQPFFYNSANEVLEKRGIDMQSVVSDAGKEDGWETD